MKPKQNPSVLWLLVVVVGVVLLVALAIEGDVKATFKILRTGFSLEATDKTVKR
jgi:hypothetical protein